jgi:hypothetical protein
MPIARLSASTAALLFSGFTARMQRDGSAFLR